MDGHPLKGGRALAGRRLGESTADGHHFAMRPRQHGRQIFLLRLGGIPVRQITGLEPIGVNPQRIEERPQDHVRRWRRRHRARGRCYGVATSESSAAITQTDAVDLPGENRVEERVVSILVANGDCRGARAALEKLPAAPIAGRAEGDAIEQARVALERCPAGSG